MREQNESSALTSGTIEAEAGHAGASPPSPLMVQYLAEKEKHPDCLLFFRMGDFYELFFDDAKKAAAALDIALTARGEYRGAPIPMCGVPFHAADAYLARLIRADFRIAVCEQLEDPAEARKRGAKSIVRRGVVRIVTPGTLTEDALLEPRTHNWLLAFAFVGKEVAIAAADISTGALESIALAPGDLMHEIMAFAPSEALYAENESARPGMQEILRLLAARQTALVPLSAAKANPRAGERRLLDLFEAGTLGAFGDFGKAELAALGMLVDYIALTQAGMTPRLTPPRRRRDGSFMAIDAATRASLEIDRNLRGERKGSLIHAVDRTVTAAGARLLGRALGRPLMDLAEIRERHDGVGFLLERPGLRADLVRALKAAPDLTRARMRLALGRGGPRDLLTLQRALTSGDVLAALLLEEGLDLVPDVLAKCARALSFARNPGLGRLAQELAAAIHPEPPFLAREGGFIQKGYDPALDSHLALRDDSRRVIAELNTRYCAETALSSLKIRHNSVLGYYIEVSARQAETLLAAPFTARFFHRQTMGSGVRFSTAELAELDRAIARAEGEALAREIHLFAEFTAAVSAEEIKLAGAADAMALVDFIGGLAEWAEEMNGIRPVLDDSTLWEIEAGRHPVVAAALGRSGTGFTPNDCALDGAGEAHPRLLIVTGPNMAGKSTFLRQNALLAILAQSGAFVPAKSMRAGLVDRVFSRVGAADDLAGGRSTFMVEMVETAAILQQAGPRSFVILDEVGRGTATYDGLAIAWAVLEHLYETNRCRGIFATHYHELTALAGAGDIARAGAPAGSAAGFPAGFPALANASLKAREWKGELVFLHEVQKGPADRSYGVEAARRAGMPKSTLLRARNILADLESSGKVELLAPLPLFSGHLPSGPPDRETERESAEPAPVPDPLREALFVIDPDSLTPKEALALLYRLKEIGS